MFVLLYRQTITKTQTAVKKQEMTIDIFTSEDIENTPLRSDPDAVSNLI